MRLVSFCLLLPFVAPVGATEPAELSRIIDAHLETKLVAAGIEPAPLVDDATFLRRVSLDVIGRLPMPEEVTAFVDDPAPDKRATLVDRLLQSPEHADHFARTWRALLVAESDTDRQIAYFVPGFEAWLRERRQQRAGFDVMVRELLTVPITGTKERPQLVLTDLKAANPIAFIACKNASAADIAATTMRLFLGVRLECAQCHNHPFDDWTQEQFWNQAAFFAGIERQGRGAFAPILEDRTRTSLMVDNSTRVAAARFLDGRDPELSRDESPRVALADWITAPDNQQFAMAISNRIWGELIGVGIVDPVDDMHAGNPPSHPELLQALAIAFRESRFDLDLLYRAICLSDVYQRTSAVGDRAADPHLFVSRVLKPMTGEQFYDSLAQAIELDRPRGRMQQRDDATRRRIVDLFAAHGNLRDPETSVVQALNLMNGPLVGRAVDAERSPVLQDLLAQPDLSDADRIEQLFLRTCSRRPTTQEREELTSYVASGGDAERARRLGDLFWSLLNSAEFRWNY